MSRPLLPRNSSFGQFLAEERGRNGYSVTRLANLAHVSPSGITDLELDRRQLTRKMATHLAGPLGLRSNTLLVAAGLTPEMDWVKTFAQVPRRTQSYSFELSAEEFDELEIFLDFLRFRRKMLGREAVSKTPSASTDTGPGP